MFWGAFAYRRRTSLVALLGDPDSARGGVTGRCILDCLQENLPTIAEPGYIFIQDNAPTHRARIVSSWLEEWAIDNSVTLVPWPPYSPDLNPIENVWKLLKEAIVTRHPELSDMPKNNYALQMLCQAAVEAWEEIQDDLFEKLIISMQRRLQAVINANGWYTKY